MNTPSLLAFIFSGFPTMSRCGEGRVMGAPARCRSCVGAARQHVTTRPGARAATAIDGRRRRVERDHATDGRAGGGGGARESNGVPVVGRQKPVTQRAATTSGLIHGQEFFPFLFFSFPPPQRLVLLFMRLVLVNLAARILLPCWFLARARASCGVAPRHGRELEQGHGVECSYGQALPEASRGRDATATSGQHRPLT